MTEWHGPGDLSPRLAWEYYAVCAISWV